MSLIKITKALEKHIQNMPGVIPGAFDGTEFEPVEGQPYKTVNLIPSPPLNPTFGDLYYRETGFMRVRLFYPDRQGKGQILMQAEAIRSHFYRSLSLAQEDIVVIIDRTPSISSVSTVGDRLVCAVDISYFASAFH